MCIHVAPSADRAYPCPIKASPTETGSKAMIFHVAMELRAETREDREEVTLRLAREKKTVEAMQQSGQLCHIWRVPGRRANISIFRVTDADELQDLLSSLPLYDFLDISVIPLACHPASLCG